MKVTIKQIAERAGVSKSLVSMYISGYRPPESFAPETRKKIDDAVKTLNYCPSLLAQSIRSGKSHTIGVVISNISLPAMAGLVQHLLDEIRNTGYQLLIAIPHYNKEEEEKNLRNLLARQVDGILYFLELSPKQEIYPAALQHADKFLLNNQPGKYFNSVSCDLACGLNGAYNYLVSNGSRNICCVSCGDNCWKNEFCTIQSGAEVTTRVLHDMPHRREDYLAMVAKLNEMRPDAIMIPSPERFKRLRICFDAVCPDYHPKVVFGCYRRCGELQHPDVIGMVWMDNAMRARIFIRRILEMIDKPGEPVRDERLSAVFIDRSGFSDYLEEDEDWYFNF